MLTLQIRMGGARGKVYGRMRGDIRNVVTGRYLEKGENKVLAFACLCMRRSDRSLQVSVYVNVLSGH